MYEPSKTHGLRVAFGGTFDPIHLGHLRAAWELAESLECPVHLIPCHTPVHRAKPFAGAQLRLEMVRAATRGLENLIADDVEVARGGSSFAVDTLRNLHRRDADCHWALVVGADAFAHFHTWKEWRAILELAHLVVINRPGNSLAVPDPVAKDFLISSQQTENLYTQRAGLIVYHEITALDISSSAVRSTVSIGRDPRFLVPQTVREIIMQRGLYR